MPSVQLDFPAAWRDYRRRTFMMFGSIVAAFPGGLWVGLPLIPRFGDGAPPIVAALLTAALVGPCSWRLWRWRCPRCGKPFHGDSSLQGHNNPFAPNCCACGLPLRETRPAA